MAYPNRKRGGERGQQPRQMTENEQISFEENFKAFVRRLNDYREQVQAVLPSTTSFEKFRAVVVMAIRREPKLLECHPTSLINACLYSAHDGLLPDGREAVIVYTYNNNAKRLEASYRSMVRGLINQILAGRKVTAIKPVIVYQNEHFVIVEGSDPRIEHIVCATDADRGEPIGCYTRAHLESGLIVTEYMTKVQIEKIRALAQTDKVWEAHWEEMAKKTVIRRHRKTLPGTSHIVDIEERIMFPQFAQEAAPALNSPVPPRPTREQFAQPRLSHEPDMGVTMDFGTAGDREQVSRDARDPDERNQREPAQRAAAEPKGKNSIAQADADWPAWRDEVVAILSGLSTADDVSAHRKDLREQIERAPRQIADAVDDAFNERLVELAAGSSPGVAGARGEATAQPAGEA